MKLLAIFAHPDDESFGPAGTLAHYACSGHQVGLVTLTRGEAGSSGISKELTPAELASRRTCELHQAVRVLGLNYLKIFDLPDKKLSEVPEQTALKLIQSEIDFFRPDILITFHERGISGHPDHQTVSRWLLQLVKNPTESRSLFFYGIIPEQAKHFSLRGLLPMTITEVTHKIAVADFVDVKIQAMKCHITQEKSWQKFIQPLEKLKSFAQWEYFKQVWPKPGKNIVIHDRF
jgi:LmbE family N-acetylglucosaminyl deacetylase